MSVEERIAWSRQRACSALMNAHRKINAGLNQQDRERFRYWFPGAGSADLMTIRDRCLNARNVLSRIDIRFIDSPNVATDPQGFDHMMNIRINTPAATFSSGGTVWIAVYPEWQRVDAYAASQVLHEAFHAAHPAIIVHASGETAMTSAWNHQGFACDLDKLPYNRQRVTSARLPR